MIKVYTYDDEKACIVERECETFGYPHCDSAGSTMYENTHFRTPAEAWDKLVRELEAGLSLGASARRDLRKRYDAVTTQLANDAERLVKAKAGREAFERETAKVAASESPR